MSNSYSFINTINSHFSKLPPFKLINKYTVVKEFQMIIDNCIAHHQIPFVFQNQNMGKTEQMVNAMNFTSVNNV